MKTAHETYEDALTKLKSLAGVSFTEQLEEYERTVMFVGSSVNSFNVTVYLADNIGIAGIDIEGIDCGAWNTSESDTLDFYVEIAEAALLGRVAINVSRVFKRKELCFKTGETWRCAPYGSKEPSVSYMTTRKKIKGASS